MFGINKTAIYNIKMLEAFEDGVKLTTYKELIQERVEIENSDEQTIEKEMLQLKDNQHRTGLHLACQGGYVELSLYIIDKYKEYELDIHQKDQRGNTPLDLVSIFGFSTPLTEDTYSEFLENRYKIIEKLVTCSNDVKKSVSGKTNNPLHWALYYGDLKSGILIFKQFPFIILKKNNIGKTPLEIAFEKIIRKKNKANAKKLFKMILENFLVRLFSLSDKENNPGDYQEVEAELDEDDMAMFYEIIKHQKSETIYKRKEMLEKFNQQIINTNLLDFLHNFEQNKNKILMGGLNTKTESSQNNVETEFKEVIVDDEDDDKPLNMNKMSFGGLFGAFRKTAQTDLSETVPKEEEKNLLDDINQEKENNFEEEINQEEDIIQEEDEDNKSKKSSKKSKKSSKYSGSEYYGSEFEISDNTISEESQYSDVEEEQTDDSNNYDFEEYEQEVIEVEEETDKVDNFLIDPNNSTLSIISLKTKIFKDQSLLLLHKMLILAVYLADLQVVKILIDNFGVNPFIPCLNGMSAVHMAAHRGRIKIMDFFIDTEFQYINSNKKIKKKKLFNMKDEQGRNTALHLAIEEGELAIVNRLIDLGVNWEGYNYKNFQPFEMSNKPRMLNKSKEVFKKDENQFLINRGSFFSKSYYDNTSWENITEDYEYLIVGRDPNEDVKKTILYRQLKKIQKTWQKDVKVKSLIPLDHKKSNYFRYYFIIKLKKNCHIEMADKLKLKIYNREKGYITQFIKEESQHFEPLRSFDIHKILYTVLNEEFSLNYYQKKGVIEAHMPLHFFKQRNSIKKHWKKNKYTTLFKNLKPKSSSRDLLPYNSIAFYYGCDIGFYLSFNAVYSSYLILLSILGVILYIAVQTISTFDQLSHRLNNFLVPIYVAFVSIWVTVAFELWTQRERELSFVWGTMDYKEKAITRTEYDGKYIIDAVTKDIRIQDSFPTKYRKWITNIPLLIIGVGLILSNFIFFTFLTNEIKLMDGVTSFMRSVYLAAAGAGNAVIIVIFTLIYNLLCVCAVRWENHRFENTRESSLVVKTFTFDFVLNYINLFYYAFFLKDFNILSTNFVSVVITKNIIFNVKTNLLPWVIYLIKKRGLIKRWINYLPELKTRYYNEEKNNIGSYLKEVEEEEDFTDPDVIQKNIEEFNALDKVTQKKMLKIEKKIILQEQIERTMVMANITDLRLVWTNYAIQFGYISFFSLAFPLAPLIGLLLNIFDLFFSYFALTDHIRRKFTKERGSIGIWTYVFMLMSFISLIVNLGVLNFSPEGVKDFLLRFQFVEVEVSSERLLTIIIIAEHIIFLIKFTLAIGIKDMPFWIETELIQRNNREKKELEFITKAYLGNKKKNKMFKKLGSVKDKFGEKLFNMAK